jgi:DNA-binding CsgD family transcriptional regulator
LAAPSPDHASTPRSLSPSALVGRDREQQRLDALLTAAADREGRLVLVGGEAGIGKTALVRHLERQAAEQGATVLAGHCYDLSATPPYGPWREVLTRLPPCDGLPALPAVLIGDDEPERGGQAAIFRQVLDVFVAVAATRPAIVVLEDLHWADPASLDLLRFLARSLAELPLLLVATYRADELTRRHPFAQLLPTLVREAPTERVELRRLDEAAMRTLIARRYPLPAAAEARLAAHLERSAEGNPFYAQELLRALEEEGVLRSGEPHWELGNLERVRVPPLLRQVVDGRLARLGETAWDRLAVAAVIGHEVPLAVWQAVGGLSEEDALETVERADEARLLEAGDDGAEVRFAHALVREALYEGIVPPRRRIWHRRVAEALLDLPATDPDAVAYHLEQAGDARAADWLVRAGERAQRAYALRTAADRFAAAVARLEGDESRAGERGWLLYRTGRMLRFADPAQGVAHLEEAERVARAVDDPILAAYAVCDRGGIHCFLGEMDRGLAAMEAGVAVLEALPADHLRADPRIATWIAASLPAPGTGPSPIGRPGTPELPVTVRRGPLAHWLAHVGRYAEARTKAAAFLAQTAEVVRPDPLVVHAVGEAEKGLALVEAAMGRPTEAQAALRRARVAYRAIDHHVMTAWSFSDELREVVIPFLTSDVAARRSLLAEAAAAWARTDGALASELIVRLFELDVLLLEGAWSEADQIARSLAASGLPTPRERAVMAPVALARWHGRPAEAWDLIGDGLPNGPATTPGGLRFRYAVALQSLAADLAMDAGDLPAAADWLAAHDRWLAWSGAVRGQADGRLRWARYFWLAGDLDRARQTAVEAVAKASDPSQPLVLLAAERLLGEIETAAGRPAEAEPHLEEALRLAEACAAPFERALTLLALAELRAAQGMTAEATKLLDEVRSITEPLGAAPTLAQVDALAARLAAKPAPADRGPRLTAREVEVLRLVAAGRSNPEIARDLFISERTVTTHLTHVYEKLAVEGRAQAVDIAVRLGLI